MDEPIDARKIESLSQQAAYFRTQRSKHMPKYTATERTLVKSIVASLSIKRIHETEIMKEVFLQTNKSISRTGLYKVKQSIKKDSSEWYSTLMMSDHEYMHQFKERIDEIIWLQRKHHELIDKFDKLDNPHVVQSSLQELHRLNVTLSNYLDVAPEISSRQKINQFAASAHEQGRELAKVKQELNQIRIREAAAQAKIARKSQISQEDLDKDEEQEEKQD
jgi:DNA-binding phage protein